jgi:hypothetical protein
MLNRKQMTASPPTSSRLPVENRFIHDQPLSQTSQSKETEQYSSLTREMADPNKRIVGKVGYPDLRPVQHHEDQIAALREEIRSGFDELSIQVAGGFRDMRSEAFEQVAPAELNPTRALQTQKRSQASFGVSSPLHLYAGQERV